LEAKGMKIELNKIYNMDCMDLMKEMNNNSVDMVITSPPYNIANTSPSFRKYNNGDEYTDSLSQNDYYEWSCKIIDELLRVSKIVFYNIQFLSGNKISLLRMLGRYANNIKDIIIWKKYPSLPAMHEKVLNADFEFVIILDKDGTGRTIEQANFKRGSLSNVWEIGRNNISTNSHGAAFPHNIPDRIIRYYTHPTDIVFDPFLGTGTTVISCIKYNRSYIGTEISKKYFDYAYKNIENAKKQCKLFT